MRTKFEQAKKVFISPFKYVTDSVSFEASKMILLLSIQFFMLIASHSFKSVIIICCTVAATIGANLISKKIFETGIFDHFSLLVGSVQGIITGMFIPESYPPLTVFLITLCTMLVVKHFFGGFSYALVNPAALVVIILWIVGVKCFPNYLISMDLISLRNPSQLMIENGVFEMLPFDSNITESLNNSIFSLFKVSIPEGYVSLLWDTHSAIPAFRFNFITILSSIIIFSDNFYKTIVPSLFLGVYLVLVRFVSPFFCNGVLYQGDMLLCLLTGGTLFTAVFGINWYGTSPVSTKGKVFYGIIAGIIAFFVAGPGTSPSGMIFTIIISNIISIVIQQWESRRDRINLRKKLDEFRKLEGSEPKEV